MPHMKGRIIPKEDIENYIDNNNSSGIKDHKEIIKLEPTMVTGQNEDGTFKVERVKEAALDVEVKEQNITTDMK